MLDIPAILDPHTPRRPVATIHLGESRQGRPLEGHRYGHGPLAVSLIGGCHADEPVGPAMLDRLAAWLEGLDQGHPLLDRFTWYLVPHANPDGEARNAPWTDLLGDPAGWSRRRPPCRVDLAAYLEGVVRELPGDDVEFGFPRHDRDGDARPENRAIASFLAAGAPFVLHGSFHGMAFAAGPWFLLDRAWIGRTAELRDRLRRQVADAGYQLHDIDRGGDKGFERIDRGFTTRPDSRAMVEHFERLGDRAMADRFRPSSMEYVRSLGGDPLTLVSEMPLFLLPAEAFRRRDPIRPPAVEELRRAAGDADRLRAVAGRHGVEAMPVADQMTFQLAFLDAALDAVTAGGS